MTRERVKILVLVKIEVHLLAYYSNLVLPLKWRYYSICNVPLFYLQRIKSFCPNGPFKLIAYSFGACVAVEMALQLQGMASDGQVSSLVLLDGSHTFVALYTGRKKDRLAVDKATIETAAITAFVTQLVLRLDVSETVS